MQQSRVRKPPFTSIRYSVRGDVEDIYQSLLKGYGSSTVLLFLVPFFSVPYFMGTPLSYIALLKSSGPYIVDYLDLHLSACPIEHPPHLSVSCGS